MALVRWARTLAAANHLRALSQCAHSTSQRAGYKSLVTTRFPGISTKWKVQDEVLELFDQKDNLLFRTNPFLFQKHGFARVAATPPHLQRQMGMKIYQGSPGVLIDPYRVRTRFPFFKRWFTREGWQQIRESLLFQLKTALAVAKLRQITGYNKKRTYEKVSTLYKQINKAIAEGDRNALRLLVTENMLSVLKKELKQREGVWARVHWETVGPLKLQTLQGRLGAADRKSTDKGIIQLTLMIISNQKFGAFDQDGKLVAGDPSKQILVEDIWVFEINLGTVQKNWRLCGRITI